MKAAYLTLFALLAAVQAGEHPDRMGQYPYYRGIAKTQPGSVWPKPQTQTTATTSLVIQSSGFEFTNAGLECTMVTDAFTRYVELIFFPKRGSQLFKVRDPLGATHRPWENEKGVFGGYLTHLDVNLVAACEDWPHQEMDESYELDITDGAGKLTANTNWGILRGLETFSQLVYRNDYGAFQINVTSIKDFPRFKHRGTMLDTGRHYLSKRVILANLDAMSYNKYNVFHWHIVDDQSFPYVSMVYPLLSQKGAFNPSTHVYTVEDMAEVIEYARVRGIRVIPEFDTPGHSYSWGHGYPELLTQCYRNDSGKLVPDGVGPMNPIVDSTYTFVKTLFAEVRRLFPDKFIHLGGDEVPFECWQSNPNITDFMQQHGMNTSQYWQLEEYYMNRVIGDLPAEASYVVWQEIFDNGVRIKPDTIVHVWKGGEDAEMEAISQKGYHMLLSSCWYLNYVQYGVNWYDHYTCEPYTFNASAEASQLVLGGEACMWTEYQDSTSVIPTFWPGAIAPAERLWSAKNVNDTGEAAPRYEEHRCRMLRRGIDASPGNGPSFCDVDMYV